MNTIDKLQYLVQIRDTLDAKQIIGDGVNSSNFYGIQLECYNEGVQECMRVIEERIRELRLKPANAGEQIPLPLHSFEA